MLKIGSVHCVYPPEIGVAPQMGRDLAVHLTQIGANVTVVCPFPTRPVGAVYPEYKNDGRVRLDLEAGVNVARLPSFTAPESKLLLRMGESLSFGWHACRYLEQHLPEVDVIYASAWPLLSHALVARYCARHRIPLVLHIQDIYPESLVRKLPRFWRSLVIFPLTALDRWIVRKAAKVVVISENMRRTYIESRNLPPEKIVPILNWVDEGPFEKMPPRAIACAHYYIPEEPFTFLYLGNIGPVAGVESLIEAFHVADLRQAQLVIAGEGSSKAACIDLAKRIAVKNVRFVSDPNGANTALLQSLGHVCLLPLREGAGMSSMPSKLMAYLLSSKPVLATLDIESDTARGIQQAQCGWVGKPEDINWLAEMMRKIAIMPKSELAEIGQRGRLYGLTHFSKAAGVRRLAGVVTDAGEARKHYSVRA